MPSSGVTGELGSEDDSGKVVNPTLLSSAAALGILPARMFGSTAWLSVLCLLDCRRALFLAGIDADERVTRRDAPPSWAKWRR